MLRTILIYRGWLRVKRDIVLFLSIIKIIDFSLYNVSSTIGCNWLLSFGYHWLLNSDITMSTAIDKLIR